MSEQTTEAGSSPEQGPKHVDDSTNETAKAMVFNISDVNHDYAKGVFLRQARELQHVFVELYKEDPSATFRLTLERL